MSLEPIEPEAAFELFFKDKEAELADASIKVVVKDNDQPWNTEAQQHCIWILGEHIARFLSRAVENDWNDWYDTHIACV